MIVQSDEPRNNRAAGEIQRLRPRRDVDGTGLPNSGDFVGGDQYRLVILRRRAGSIDEPYVRERHHRRVDRHEGTGSIAESRALCGG